MLFVDGGEFNMGSEDGDSNEKAVHKVYVDDFYIGSYAVKVDQFRQFINATNYRTDAEKQGWSCIWTGEMWESKEGANGQKPGYSQTDKHPVVCVSWNDAIAFCEWLLRQTGKEIRLPTEAEWEYAACGGSHSRGYKYSGSKSGKNGLVSE